MTSELMICPACHGTRFRVRDLGRTADQRSVLVTVCASIDDLGCYWHSEPRLETECKNFTLEPISVNYPSNGTLTLAE